MLGARLRVLGLRLVLASVVLPVWCLRRFFTVLLPRGLAGGRWWWGFLPPGVPVLSGLVRGRRAVGLSLRVGGLCRGCFGLSI